MSDKKQPEVFIHGSKLRNKAAVDTSLQRALRQYEKWRDGSLAITGRTSADIQHLTDLLNAYKDAVEPIFDARANSAQEVLQPSILEEFFEYLFCGLSTELGVEVLRRPASGYIGLAFNPKSLRTLVTTPEYTIRRKDHDFVIGANVDISLGAKNSGATIQDTLVVPAIALECKRYLERNMLDECAGTAEKIKKATPYCRFIVISEYLKMDDASPEISLIDEIYVLRKQRNSERLAKGFIPNPIYGDLVQSIYADCVSHLKKTWWDPESGLKTGKMFNFS